MTYEAVDRWNSPYIEHHGVKGMKWGVRHDPEVDRLKSRIKEAKKQRNKVYKSNSRISSYGYYNASPFDKVAKASNRVADRKAQLAKYKNGEKGEINSYAKSLNNGLMTDQNALMIHLKTQRGEKYAQKVYERSQRRVMNGILGGEAAIVGALAVATYLSYKY